MTQESQIPSFDLTIGSILNQEVKEGTTGEQIEENTIMEEETIPQNQPTCFHNTLHSGNFGEGKLVVDKNENSGELNDSESCGDATFASKTIIGSPDFSFCNNAPHYFETVTTSVQKKFRRLKMSRTNKQDLASQTLSLSPSLRGHPGIEEPLYRHFQTQPYPKQSNNYKNYYTKETRRSETSKIYNVGNSGDNQNILDDPPENMIHFNDIPQRRNDICFVNTTGQESLQSQYLIPQLQNPPIVFGGPFEYLPSTSCNDNLASSSTNMEIGTFGPNFLNRNKMLVQNNTQISKLNDQSSMDNMLPERQVNRQPDCMCLSAINPNDFSFKEIQNIEYFTKKMDRNANREAFSIERYIPEYWAFLTNRLTKIKIQCLLNGLNYADCDRKLSKIHLMEKLPKEFWYPSDRPSTSRATSHYTPYKERRSTTNLELSRNDKNHHSYNYGREGRQRRKNPGGSRSIMQAEISELLQNRLQITEVCTSNQKETQQQK